MRSSGTVVWLLPSYIQYNWVSACLGPGVDAEDIFEENSIIQHTLRLMHSMHPLYQ